MNRIDISKIWFYATLIIGAISLAFIVGLYSGSKQNRLFRIVETATDNIERTVTSIVPEYLTFTSTRPFHFLQKTTKDGDGVTINSASVNQNELIFLSGFFEEGNQLRLIRRDGQVVQRWPLRFFDIFEDRSYLSSPPRTEWHVDTHGALALPDGSVVFNFDFCGLVKLDRCGKVVWKIAHETHHTLEKAEGGGFWVSGRRLYKAGEKSPFPPYMTPLSEDTILRVSEDGKIVREISVPGLFYKNGLESLLTATGNDIDMKGDGIWDREILHLNKIEELPSALAADFPQFEAGDLALSLKFRNMILIMDPDTEKIKWWRIGPWIYQHDPEFKAGGTIAVFNNNIYDIVLPERNVDEAFDYPYVSNIIELAPATDQYQVTYGGTKGQEMLSTIRGKLEVTANGGYLVTEFEGGRVFETDSSGQIIWEYINRYDSGVVAEITEARVYPQSYFTVPDWTACK